MGGIVLVTTIGYPAYDPEDLLSILLVVGSSLQSMPNPEGCHMAHAKVRRTGSGRVPVYLCAEQTPGQRPFVWRSIRLPSYELVVDRDVHRTKRSHHEQPVRTF